MTEEQKQAQVQRCNECDQDACIKVNLTTIGGTVLDFLFYCWECWAYTNDVSGDFDTFIVRSNLERHDGS